ncbi:hypothetical protein ACWA5Z_12265 [Testudinibacter sp. P80/BLE/0925]|uniref:hypothetical protein n=1 Tax=Testudinibacter sp. TW-1 TaxID=3417757 RepID=UPI003D361A8C
MNAILLSFLKACCANVDKAAKVFAVIFVVGLLWLQYENKIQIEKQSHTIDALRITVAERNAELKRLNDTLAIQADITKQQLAHEQEKREQADDQVKTIRELLKGNVCGDTHAPAAVLEQLRK